METSDEQLDDLLSQARWPQPSVEQEQRLQDGWRALSRRRRIMPLVWCAAAAAIVLIVAGPVFVALRSEPVLVPSGEKIVLMVTEAPSHQQPSRAPTAYERLAMISSKKKPPARSAPAPVAPAPPTLAEMNAMTRSESADVRRSAMQMMLARNDSAGIAAYLACMNDPKLRDDAKDAVAAMPQPPREALLREFENPLIDNRRAAAIALGTICDESLANRLSAMVETETSPREALAALLAAPKDVAASLLAGAAQRNPTVGSQILAIQLESPELN